MGQPECDDMQRMQEIRQAHRVIETDMMPANCRARDQGSRFFDVYKTKAAY
jgi:hypothetical protein